MNIILTGATGIIGREVLAELILHHLHNQPFERIICLARKSRTNSAGKRIELIKEGIMHDLQMDSKAIDGLVHVVDTTDDAPHSFNSLIQFIQVNRIAQVSILHLASSTNLSPLANTEEEIFTESYLPTIDLLQVSLPFLKKFSFVSTAFSCGHQPGLIPNELIGMSVRTNRNYYERFKHMAECKVKEICEQNGIQWQVLRSSIVSGRLLRKPYYYTPKFNVFYAWTGFFASLKANQIDCEGIRIQANPDTGVNIVSSDYVAKSTVRAFFHNDITELNLTHSRNVENTVLIPTMLESVGIKRFEYVDTVPSNPTVAEKLYYKTAGLQFSPYLHTQSHQYDSSKIRNLMTDVPEPNIKAEFGNILNYAIEHQFKNENI